MRQTIKKFGGQIIGTIEVDSSGSKTVRDFSGKILGYYDSRSNYTKTFMGEILYEGDMAAALLVVRY